MSSCACINSGYGCYGIYNSEIRTAHKPRRIDKPKICCECNREISIGEKYCHQTFLYDGSWDYMNTCTDCWSIVQAFFCSWVRGYAIKEAEEHIIHKIKGNVGSEQILKLTPKARDWVFGLIERAWEIYPEEPDPINTFERGWVRG